MSDYVIDGRQKRIQEIEVMISDCKSVSSSIGER